MALHRASQIDTLGSAFVPIYIFQVNSLYYVSLAFPQSISDVLPLILIAAAKSNRRKEFMAINSLGAMHTLPRFPRLLTLALVDQKR